LLAVQERIGLQRNVDWLGRTVEVLVDGVVPPRSHDHDGGGESTPRVAGRTRQHKLVHFAADPSLVGRIVDVHVEHAGPYALRGTLATA
jgi:tRNA A37 methylthiotransferase MiaB